MTESAVTVELFGLARRRAGMTEISAEGRTVRELLLSVVRSCPGLRDLLAEDGTIAGHYLVSLDGREFVDDPSQPVPPAARLLILGADPGG